MTASILSSFHSLRQAEPDRLLFTFVDDHGADVAARTVAELGAAADRVAAALREWGIAAGDRVLLVYPPSLEFVDAFLGCLAAGVIPVPVYPPNPLKFQGDAAGLTRIAESSGARAVLTTRAYDRLRAAGNVRGLFTKNALRWPGVPWLHTDGLRQADPPIWHEPEPDEPALLQYTSGSTGHPKGVIISHRNLADEVAANARDLSLGKDTRGVFWLPQYHDFGLISVISSTMVGNSCTTLMSPLTFLQRPAVWMDVMARVRATHTAAPNFAFDLVVRKTTPEQRAGWDLSSLRMIMSAAEPVRKSTMDTFFTAFAGARITPDTFRPAYGLAEHTVSVTTMGTSTLRVDRDALEAGLVRTTSDGVTLMGCGRINKPDAVVRIVDPVHHRVCAPDEVGEIWVDSSTKALGYWGLPVESDGTFRAKLTDRIDGREYLRTGDLGFFHGGELYVTGRHKELIILRGRNLHPADIEAGVRDCHPAIRPGGVAAFGADTGHGEQLVVFVETRDSRAAARRADEVIDAVRRTIYESHQLACHAIAVGPAGLVRKTTSGKLRRLACREAFTTGEITKQAFRVWTATTLVEELA